jgi:hypothetical protein
MVDQLADVVAMARSAWGHSQVVDSQAGETPENTLRLLAKRDELRRECARWIAEAKRLHSEQRINAPWHEWAPRAFGWSYTIIKQRLREDRMPSAQVAGGISAEPTIREPGGFDAKRLVLSVPT